MVTIFLSHAVVKEIQNGHKQVLTRWQNRASEFKITFVSEMKRYARQQYPYNEPLRQDQSMMDWWKAIEGRDFAQILPVRTLEHLCLVFSDNFVGYSSENFCCPGKLNV